MSALWHLPGEEHAALQDLGLMCLRCDAPRTEEYVKNAGLRAADKQLVGT
jgi:hypothetical protein